MKARIGQNPEFATITGLTNRNFNPASITEGQMVTEEQLLEVYERIVADEAKADACCRDIVFWEARTQVVRMNTLNIAANNNLLGGGTVLSTFDENVNIGIARRGLGYTVAFPVKWDEDLYVRRDAITNANSGCGNFALNAQDVDRILFVNYRIVENNTIRVGNCAPTTNNYAGFWHGLGKSLTSNLNNDRDGYFINNRQYWTGFVHNIKDDGTVTITDNRRKTDFDIVRFYTQWILRETADGQMIPDPE